MPLFNRWYKGVGFLGFSKRRSESNPKAIVVQGARDNTSPGEPDSLPEPKTVRFDEIKLDNIPDAKANGSLDSWRVSEIGITPSVGFSMVNTLEEMHEAMDRNDILTLPHNIYSAAIILPFTRNPRKSKIETTWQDFQLLVLVSINCVAQSFLIYFINDTFRKAEDQGQCGTSVVTTNVALRAVAEAIFVGYCLIDLVETWNMIWWWIDISGAISDSIWAGLNDFLTGLCCFLIKWDLKRETTFVNSSDGVEDNISKGLANNIQNCALKRKLFCALILLCKTAICVLLAYFGTGFLLTSESDSDLILNALALTFVLELDEMFYQFFLTTEMRVIVETVTPMVLVTTDENSSWFLSNMTVIWRGSILAGTTMFMYSIFCTDFWSTGQYGRD